MDGMNVKPATTNPQATQEINDYTKATNWNVESVKKVEKATDGTETTTTVNTNNELSVTKDCTIKVYYTPKTKDFDGATTFYDYTVKAVTDDEARNNNNTYYSFNNLGEEPDNGRKWNSHPSPRRRAAGHLLFGYTASKC